MTEKKQRLTSDLKKFGLNPLEWTIIGDLKEARFPQLIVHKKDQGFRLLGTTKSKGRTLSWNSISYLSL